METRLDSYINKKELTQVFGVSVRRGGRWMRVSDNGEIFIGTRDKAEAIRAEMRKH